MRKYPFGLTAKYRTAMKGYVTEKGGEAALLAGQDCARLALEKGLGVLDMLSIHHRVLLTSVLGPLLNGNVQRLASMSSDFLCESLAPFEMTIRGFKEANQSLRTLNETLEERVQERTEELERTVGTLQRVLGGTVEAISTIVEKRDPYTAGHQQRVSLLACAIAEEMGLTRKQIDGIDIAGVIHDIGKIAIPSEILSTPRQLSGNEFDLIRIHSQAGYDILKTIEFPWPVAQIVLQHHERMDGSGYPAGLAGEDILPEARIIAVADVVEAMSSHRPYRPALGVAKALEEIYEKKGVFYDAPVVDACLALFIERGFKFE